MYRVIYVVVILSVAIGFVWSNTHVTPAEQCPGKNFEGLRERIEVVPCGKTRCKLRKGTNITVNFKFNPKHEIKELTNDVQAEVLGGIKLPFIGIHGASACAEVRRVDTGAPAPCPLSPGQEYVYTNVFPVEQFYPELTLRVHWGLKEGGTQEDVICFEVPAVIVKGSAKTRA